MSERHPRHQRPTLPTTDTDAPGTALVDIRDLGLTLAGRPVSRITAGVAAALRPAAVARVERPSHEPTEATIKAGLRSILAAKLASATDPTGDGTRYVLPGGAMWATAEGDGSYAVRFAHER